MPDVELEPLLSPLPGDAPCGADLEYDPAFLALQLAGPGKPEQQYRDTGIPAEEPAGLAALMQAGHDAVQGIAAVLEQRLEATQSPEFAPLKKLLQRVAEAARRATGSAAVVADGAAGEAAPKAVAAGTITSREDAIC